MLPAPTPGIHEKIGFEKFSCDPDLAPNSISALSTPSLGSLARLISSSSDGNFSL